MPFSGVFSGFENVSQGLLDGKIVHCTSLKYKMNAKLCQQMFWVCHDEDNTPRNLNVSCESGSSHQWITIKQDYPFIVYSHSKRKPYVGYHWGIVGFADSHDRTK